MVAWKGSLSVVAATRLQSRAYRSGKPSARRLQMGRLDNLKPAASAPSCRTLVVHRATVPFGLGRQFEVESAKGRMDGRGVDV
jgi:hypothetical protein